jgi:hypothetical protein
MLRIAGIQRNSDPDQEFVLLKNQGLMKTHLRGHMIADENAFAGPRLSDRVFVFADDVVIPPAAYVMVVTGHGENGWGKSSDGSLVYYAFWNKSRAVWAEDSCPIHVLGVLHSKPAPGVQWAAVAAR